MLPNLSPYAESTILAHPKLKERMLEQLNLDFLQYQLIAFKSAQILIDYPELVILLKELPAKLKASTDLFNRLSK